MRGRLREGETLLINGGPQEQGEYGGGWYREGLGDRQCALEIDLRLGRLTPLPDFHSDLSDSRILEAWSIPGL